MKEVILRAKDIKKQFSSPAPLQLLRGISIEVARGSSIAIMGKSGEGKSTLLHILGALEAPTEGEIEICGQKATSSDCHTLRNRHIGFIFQSYHLLEEYTALENVLMPARIARQPIHVHSPAYERALGLLDTLGIRSRAHFLSKLLSGGEKQRVAIARALCNDPALILADEPSGNLDRAQSHEIHALLIGLTREYQKTLIVVTHDRDLACLCDTILVLKEGYLE